MNILLNVAIEKRIINLCGTLCSVELIVVVVINLWLVTPATNWQNAKIAGSGHEKLCTVLIQMLWKMVHTYFLLY